MMTPLALLLALAATGVPSRPAQAQDDPFRIPIEELVLDNGMRILIVDRKDVPRVYCSLWWRVGAVHERPGATGLSHFFEHMMFMGTDVIGTKDNAKDAELNARIEAVMGRIRAIKLDRLERARRGDAADAAAEAAYQELWKEYQALVDAQKAIIIPEHLSKLFQSAGGTGLNATTSWDRTNYFVELPSNKVELFCWLESDRFLKPVFRSFYPEREVVKEERRMRTDSTPTGLIQEAYWASFWQAHPYRWPVIGWMSDIDQYTLEDARRYYDVQYSPQNCTAIFVGDVDVPSLKELCRRYFGRLQRRPTERDPVVTVEPDQVAERRMRAEADSNDEVHLRWHGPAGVHRDTAACDLLMAVFGGRSGRLYRPLVEERKLALDVEAWYFSLRYGGVIHLGASPREGVDPAAVEQALLEQVREVQEKGVTERELQKARNQQLADLVRGLKTHAGLARQLGYFETIGTQKDFFAYAKALQSAGADDLQRCAKQYLKSGGLNALTIVRKEKR
jgi:predicted Zn-dependent peptidase